MLSPVCRSPQASTLARRPTRVSVGACGFRGLLRAAPITGSRCCARAASGHAAAPPSAAITSRRPIVTGMWMGRTRQQSRFTALDIYSRNVCREFCGSAQQGACWQSRAACRGAFAASANPLSRSVFLVRASRQIKVVRCQLSFKERSRPECRSRDQDRGPRAPD